MTSSRIFSNHVYRRGCRLFSRIASSFGLVRCNLFYSSLRFDVIILGLCSVPFCIFYVSDSTFSYCVCLGGGGSNWERRNIFVVGMSKRLEGREHMAKFTSSSISLSIGYYNVRIFGAGSCSRGHFTNHISCRLVCICGNTNRC